MTTTIDTNVIVALRSLDERAAGRAFQTYAVRKGYHLLTLDGRLYRAAFPALKLVQV